MSSFASSVVEPFPLFFLSFFYQLSMSTFEVLNHFFLTHDLSSSALIVLFLALLFTCYCFHGFQSPLHWSIHPHHHFHISLWHFHFLFYLFFCLVSCYIMSLFWFCSSNLYFYFPDFLCSRHRFPLHLCFLASHFAHLLFHVACHSAAILWSLIISLVFSSGGVSWEGQLIYAPKKGTNIWLWRCVQRCWDLCLLSVN